MIQVWSTKLEKKDFVQKVFKVIQEEAFEEELHLQNDEWQSVDSYIEL
jgi:hypothetical protein